MRRIVRPIVYEIRAWLEWVVIFLPKSVLGDKIRLWYWRRKLANPHLRYMGFGARVFAPSRLSLGRSFALGDYSALDIAESDPVYIGNGVSIARGTYLRSANHAFHDLTKPAAEQGHTSKTIEYQGGTYSIVVEDNVWIAAHCIILSGAFVGEGAVVGAGTVVSSRVPPFAVVVGSGFRVVGDRRTPRLKDETDGLDEKTAS